VLLLAWEIYGQLLNPILLSSPTAVVAAGAGMIADGSLPQALAESLIVLSLGLTSGVAVGVTLGLLAGRSETLSALLELPVNAVYATPAVALIPIIVLWFGFEVTAKVVVVFLFVVFPVLINTTRGVREVDPELIEVARTFCSSERRMWKDLILPSALPENAGLTPSSVAYVPVSSDGYIGALVQGSIQSAILQQEQVTNVLQRDHSLHVLVNLYQALPDYFYGPTW
jgi:ABC-type nitrate/sulfonate/bicarbonate transport system permease component